MRPPRGPVPTLVLIIAAVLAAPALAAVAQDAEPQPVPDAEASADRPARQDGEPLSDYYGFGAMEILKLEHGLGRPHAVDVNRDGRNDLVVVDNRRSRIELLCQKAAFDPDAPPPPPAPGADEDVNDVFDNERAWRFKRYSFPLDVAVSSLVTADLNRDGWIDLAYYSNRGLYVVLQDPPAEAPPPAKGVREPAWLPPTKIDLDEGVDSPDALATGDLNADGRPDLALLASDGAFVLTQKDDGRLAQPVRFPSGARVLRKLLVADLDGDGLDDMALLTNETDYPLRVRFQSADGRLGPESRFNLPAPAVLEACRLREDAGADVVSVAAQSGRVETLRVAPDPREATYPVFTYPLPGTEAAEHRDTVAADLNDDGLLELVVTDPSRAEFLLFRGDRRTGPAGPEHFPGLMEMRKLVAADLDARPGAEIVALSTKEKIIGVSRLEKGRLTFPDAVEVTGDPVAMNLADVNGDGAPDIVYVAEDQAEDSSERTWTLRTLLTARGDDPKPGPELELTELKDKPRELLAGDVDHDGRADLMIFRPYDPVLLIRQDADGRFVQVAGRDVNSGLLANVQPEAVSFAPLAGDGKTAVLIAQRNFARSLVFDAEDGWTVLDQYQAPDKRSNLTVAAAGRVEGVEGEAILAYDAARGKLVILAARDDGTYGVDSEVDVGSMSATKILVGDFGGGAAASVVVCGAHKFVRIPTAADTRMLSKYASFETEIEDARFGALACEDVNDDGVPDVILIDQNRHHVEICTFTAAGELVSATRFKVFEQPRRMESNPYETGPGRGAGEPRSVAVADVTDDGLADLVLLVHDRIIVYPQDRAGE